MSATPTGDRQTLTFETDGACLANSYKWRAIMPVRLHRAVDITRSARRNPPRITYVKRQDTRGG